jgi:hypothetical protein
MRRSFLDVVNRLAPLAFCSAALLGAVACSGSSGSSASDAERDGKQAAALSSSGAPIVGLAGKCLDDAGDGTADGNRLQLYTCNGTDAQQWTYVNGTLVGPGGKCLDDSGDATNDGNRIQLYSCNGTRAQQWSYVNDTLVGPAGKCLDVTNEDSADGTPLQLWSCTGGKNQQWTLNGSAGSTPTPPPTTTAPPPPPVVSSSTLHSVYIGNDPTQVAQYESWLGKPTDGILSYTGDASWADYDGSVGYAINLWAPLDRRVLWSVSFIPDGANLADAASGAYDAHYLAAAKQLASFRPQDGVLYIRTAWEWNGNWFPWSVSQSDTGNFIAAWHHFVDAFRSVSPRFRFDWCPSLTINPYPLEDAYPGDDYVDVIGADVYDEDVYWKIQDPDARWEQEYLTSDHGLNWLSSFAAAHGKGLSVPEWGTGGSGSGDDPSFVSHMNDWLEANHALYASYWNSSSVYTGQLSYGQWPNAGAEYRKLFGP